MIAITFLVAKISRGVSTRKGLRLSLSTRSTRQVFCFFLILLPKYFNIAQLAGHKWN
jgi:hypothetical protein